MHKKAIFQILLLLLLTASLFAQTSVGVEGGLSYNNYLTNIANRSATALSGKAGFGIAAPFRYRVRSWLYGIAALGLMQKGYALTRTDSLAGIYDQHTNLYLQLPVGVGLVHEWGRFRVGLDLGVYTGYWLSGRQKGATADIFGATGAGGAEQFKLVDYNASYSFNAQRDNRWEEGWWTGLDLHYRLTDDWSLTTGVKYYDALTSQEKNSIPAYNQPWLVSIGGTWSLSRVTSVR